MCFFHRNKNKMSVILDESLVEEIKSIYGNNTQDILNEFIQYAQRPEWVSHDKVIRTIIKISNGDLEKTIYYLNIANRDPRDVLLLANETD